MARRQWDVVYMRLSTPSCLIKAIIVLRTYTRHPKFKCLLQNMEPLTSQLKREDPDTCATYTSQEQTQFSCITNAVHVTTWKALSYTTLFHGAGRILNMQYTEFITIHLRTHMYQHTSELGDYLLSSTKQSILNSHFCFSANTGGYEHILDYLCCKLIRFS